MKIPEKVGSKYRLILLAGERVTQLQRGAQPRLENAENMKLTTIAMQEVMDELLVFNKIPVEDEDGQEAS